MANPFLMKSYAFALLATTVLFFAVASSATAQAPPRHPDPTAVLIGTFSITISVGGGSVSSRSSRPGAAASEASSGCQVKANVSVWRTSTGQIDYIIDAASIEYIGDCGAVDLATSDVFGQLAKAALQYGIQAGFSECTPNCAERGYGRVYSALCVRKTGSGGSTRYVPCDMTSFCYREYVYCCPNGTLAPEITEVPRAGDGCGAGAPAVCEPTCGSSNSLLMD